MMNQNSSSHMFFKPNLHQAHVFTPEERQEVIINNLAIDWKMGHRNEIEKALEINPEWRKHFDMAKKESVELLKRRSLLLLALFTSGICDANCEICYTDRRESEEELTLEELKKVIDQALELGAKTIYIPGEGEPFISSYFFELVDYICKERHLNLVVFTNGILLSDEDKFRKYWGISLDKFIESYIKQYNIFFYVKLWHVHPEKIKELIGSEIKLAPYSIFIGSKEEQIHIPAFLMKLITDKSLINKAGIETAVFKKNFDAVVNYLIPFIKQTGIKWYLEPILHAGRYFGKRHLDLDPIQEGKVASFYNKQQCKRALYAATVTSCGYVTFCPVFKYVLKSFLPNDFKVLVRNIREESLFNILHNDKFSIKLRYGSLFYPCLCEHFSSNLSKQKIKTIEAVKSIKI